MAETSRSQVTITLGRSGQVVKMAGDELDSAFSNSHRIAGSKRSIRDRLGTNVEFNNKSQLKGLNLTGQLPSEISKLPNLLELDLSFNRLTGQIPDSMVSLNKISFLYLNNNSLTGAISSWISNSKYNHNGEIVV